MKSREKENDKKENQYQFLKRRKCMYCFDDQSTSTSTIQIADTDVNL